MFKLLALLVNINCVKMKPKPCPMLKILHSQFQHTKREKKSVFKKLAEELYVLYSSALPLNKDHRRNA